MVSRLEQVVNDTLAAQVEQSAAGKVNDQIPFILDLVITSGFRQFKVDFDVPPGLGGTTRGASKHPDRQLLFYEIQHSATPAFVSPSILQTPQISVLIGGFGLGERRYFRARVINTKQQASPWTDTVASISARGRISVTDLDGGDITARLTASQGSWQNIINTTYSPSEGFVSIKAHVAVGAIQENVGAFIGGPAHVQFRWRVDLENTAVFSELDKGARCVMAAIPGDTTIKKGKAPMAFGTFLTPFIKTSGTNDIGIQLQASLRPGSDWAPSGNLPSNPLIFTRNVNVIEVLESF
jgi:hypothetical protein